MKRDKIIQFETMLDHLSGEEIGIAICELNELPEVLDAIFLTGIGKKNRTVGILQVLCYPEHETQILNSIFRHTHTLGVRRQEIERFILDRENSQIDFEDEMLPAKTYVLENATYYRPEADAIRKLIKRRKIGAPALRFRRWQCCSKAL